MACGCAFLTMNDPPMDYVIDHRENGLLVDHSDDVALARNARETVVEWFSRAAVAHG